MRNTRDGKPFTSEDVTATFDRIKNPFEGMVSPRQAQFEPVDTIEATDDYTVAFNLSRPMAALLPLIAQGWNVIYSAKDIAEDFDFEHQVNGTGPFRFRDYLRGNRFVNERNEGYHVEGRPYLDGVTIFIIPDTSTALASFQSGELDMLRGANATERETLQGALGDDIVVDGPSPSCGFGSINFGQADPWRDVRLRQAFAMAMDREQAITLLNQGDGYVGGYYMPDGVWANPPERDHRHAGLPAGGRCRSRRSAEAA